MTRFRRFYVLPILLVSGWLVWPLADGDASLYLRDTLSTHYALKSAHAQLMDDGAVLPLIDPYRSGGQPLLGNPNALPLYPTNLLYRAAPSLWALNAHFWIHFLLAPWAFFVMGRAFGLSRPAAVAAGVTYASSGFFLSQLNLYNLVTGTVWAPLFIAACLLHRRRPGPRTSAGVAVGLTLLVLSGDPMTAALGAFAGLAAWALSGRTSKGSTSSLLGALAAAAALSAPLWIEMLRILPLSYRGFHSSSVESSLTQSWNPWAALDGVVPFFFGRIDYSFWGYDVFDGHLPLLFSLFPGPLLIALVLGAGRPRLNAARVDGRAWAWGLVVLGLFLATGSHNPVIRALYELPFASSLRYPVKCMLLVAVGLSLLAGFGFERFLRGDDGLRRRLRGIALAYAAAWGILLFMPGDFRSWIQDAGPILNSGERFATQHAAWLLDTLTVLIFCVIFWSVARWVRDRHLAGALLLLIHFSGQLYLLQPLIDTVSTEDGLRELRDLPQPLAQLPDGIRLLHGAGAARLFGAPPMDLPQRFEDPALSNLTRLEFRSAAPYAGIAHGFPYELNRSPEGLDSFTSVALAKVFPGLNDAERVRIAAALGVDALLLQRPLDPSIASTLDPPRIMNDPVLPTWLYTLPRSLPEVVLVGRTFQAPSPGDAIRQLSAPSFDPRTMAVHDGEGPALDGDGGTAQLLHQSAEKTVVEVESEAGGLLVTQRAWLPIYRAFVDGVEAPLEVVNIYKTGVRVPAGRHRVEIATDRRPTRAALALSLATVFFLAWRLRRPGDDPGAGLGGTV